MQTYDCSSAGLLYLYATALYGAPLSLTPSDLRCGTPAACPRLLSDFYPRCGAAVGSILAYFCGGLQPYSCDSKESSQNIVHCTLIHLVPHAGKKVPLNQTERNVVKRTPRYGSSVTLGVMGSASRWASRWWGLIYS